MQTATFTFIGIKGFVTRSVKDTFVQWGTASFQIEAAKPQLRKVIEDALTEASEQQRNRQAYMGSLSRNARKAQHRDL